MCNENTYEEFKKSPDNGVDELEIKYALRYLYDRAERDRIKREYDKRREL